MDISQGFSESWTLPSRAGAPQACAEFQTLFAKAGVKLVYVKAFPGGKLDVRANRGRRLPRPARIMLYPSTPVGQLTPFGPWLQYPPGFLCRYCWCSSSAK